MTRHRRLPPVHCQATAAEAPGDDRQGGCRRVRKTDRTALLLLLLLLLLAATVTVTLMLVLELVVAVLPLELVLVVASAVVPVGLFEGEGGSCEGDTQYRRRSAGSR